MSEGSQVRCVGALIRDARNRVYVHHRSADRRLLPGTWDVVGGHVEPGETPHQALAREIEEETGWRLRRIEAGIADWEWTVHDGIPRHELDYLVEVDGDLSKPRLEAGKHDACAWVGPDDLELMMQGRTDGDTRLRDLVAKAARTRITERLRLEPAGPEHAGELWSLHYDEGVAAWHGGRWTALTAQRRAAEMGEAWERRGACRWIAYRRSDGALAGRGGLSFAEVDGRERLELGWTVPSGLWGQGYATEIGRAGLAFAFTELGAARVVAFAKPHDQRSLSVMHRLGMRCTRGILYRGEPFVLYELARPGNGGTQSSD
ncbi:MAG TPA: GNAT family N-acetyltransferase [Streptosporangiaceae bacterium]